MEENELKQKLNLKFSQEAYLSGTIEAFLTDRKVQNMATGTLRFYRFRLSAFLEFCEGQEITQVTQIDATLIRKYMLVLEETGHNPGGQHTYYRAIKTFLRWWED